MPTLDVTLAAIVTTPFTSAPDDGLVIVTTGALPGIWPFSTLLLIPALDSESYGTAV